jgi:ferredoxin
VVIGTRMKGVTEADALAYVAGYTCANDVGLHDFRHADRGSMLRVKGQDGFLPLGPQLVDATSTPRTSDPHVSSTARSSRRRTRATCCSGVAYQLADLSRLITLEPGDVVLTGHAGEQPPMEPGDTVEVEIDGIGGSPTRSRTGTSTCRPGEQPATSARPCTRARRPEDEARAHGGSERSPDDPVHVDMNLCQSHGECSHVATTSSSSATTTSCAGRRRSTRRARDAAREAADACPMMAIRVED